MRIEVTPSTDPVAVRLVQDLLADLDERYGPEEDGGAAWLAETAPHYVSPPSGVFVVAYLDDGTPAGCGAVKRYDDEAGELKRMFTAPAGRGQGIGRALLVRLEEEARRIGYSKLRLETGSVQHEAVGLYTSMGYEPIEPYGMYKDHPHTLCFEKRL